MRDELKLIGAYVRAVFRQWWMLTIEGLLVLIDLTERLFTTWLQPALWIKVTIGLAVLMVAQYLAYRNVQQQVNAPATKEIISKQLREIYREGERLRWKIVDSDDTLTVADCQRESQEWRARLRSCVEKYVSQNKALYVDSVQTVPQKFYSRMTKSNTTKADKGGIVGHLDTRLERLLEIINEI